MTLFCLNQKKERLSTIIDYYSTYHTLYLKMWGNTDNLAIHMGYYDDTVNTHTESLLKMNEYISSLSNIRKNDRILDAGCGVGGTTIWIAKKFGCKVTGISLSNNEIELAKKIRRKKSS